MQTLTSAGALAGWTRPPSRGDKSRQSPGPEEQRTKSVVRHRSLELEL